jgi:hypothetical protein
MKDREKLYVQFYDKVVRYELVEIPQDIRRGPQYAVSKKTGQIYIPLDVPDDIPIARTVEELG